MSGKGGHYHAANSRKTGSEFWRNQIKKMSPFKLSIDRYFLPSMMAKIGFIIISQCMNLIGNRWDGWPFLDNVTVAGDEQRDVRLQ